jgi:hypothetical protein
LDDGAVELFFVMMSAPQECARRYRRPAASTVGLFHLRAPLTETRNAETGFKRDFSFLGRNEADSTKQFEIKDLRS